MRVEQLTFTRFLAAIAIVIFHFGIDLFPFNDESILFLFKKANIGVSYFFILSGFVMIIAYSNKSKISSLEFLKNRFARIYPLYFLAICMMFLFMIISHKPLEIPSLILNILLIQTWIPGQSLTINAPGWSLSVEFFFYALFPFLLNRIYNKNPLNSLAAPILLFWLISQLAFHLFLSSHFYSDYPSKIHDFTHYFPLMHLNEFLIGNLFGLFFTNKLVSQNKNYDWIIVIILLLIMVMFKNPIGLNFHNGLISLFFAPLILLLASSNGKITTLFRHKFLVFLGEISFGVYILQVPIFLFTKNIFKFINLTNPQVSFYCYLTILIAFSALSYIFIETPLRNKIKDIHLASTLKKQT